MLCWITVVLVDYNNDAQDVDDNNFYSGHYRQTIIDNDDSVREQTL